jgi:hypothetical protein
VTYEILHPGEYKSMTLRNSYRTSDYGTWVLLKDGDLVLSKCMCNPPCGCGFRNRTIFVNLDVVREVENEQA